MNKKKRPEMQYRYYTVPSGAPVLALLGDKWRQHYGEGINYLHFHNLFEIGYCHYGDGTLTFDEEERSYQDEMFTLIPKFYPHTTNSNENKMCFWEYLFFDVEKIIRESYPDNQYMTERLIGRINKNAHLISVKKEPRIAELISVLMEVMRTKKEFYLEEAKAVVLALLIEIARYNKGQEEEEEVQMVRLNDAIMPAVNYIQNNYMKNIKIAELAVICHISETHFRRVFLECMHTTPLEYVNFTRISRACEMLKTTDASISAIASRTGFVSLSTFNRNFAKYMGVSPQQWRVSDEVHRKKLRKQDIKIMEGW